MALIKCSECSKEVSDKVKACLNCGDDIQKQIKLARAKRKWKDIPKKEKIQAAIFGGAVGVMSLFVMHSCLAPKTAKEIEQENKDGASGVCQLFIKEQLNDPDSMEMIYHGNKVMHVEKNIYETNIDFKAKNAFGASIPASYHCVVRLEGEDFHLVSLKRNH